MKIKVTKEHLQSGDKNSRDNCGTCKAIKHAMNACEIWINNVFDIVIDEVWYRVDPKDCKRVAAALSGKEAFEFELEKWPTKAEVERKEMECAGIQAVHEKLTPNSNCLEAETPKKIKSSRKS